MDNIAPCPPDADMKTESLLQEACHAEYMVDLCKRKNAYAIHQSWWERELSRLTKLLNLG